MDFGECMDIFMVAGQGYDSNVFVVLGTVPTVVDTGTGLNSGSVIQVVQRFVNPELIQQVVLTHEHYDHVGGVESLLKVCGKDVRVYANQETAVKLREGRSAFAEMLGGHLPRVEINDVINEGDSLQLGDSRFEVMVTPGHSMGSICLFEPVKKVLFSGDTVFAHGDFGRFDLPGGDYMSLRGSIERIGSLGVLRLYPGHGPVVEDEAGKHIEKAMYNVTSYG
jgi:glyoxylase-like metal-dependent hydrolase (beta-lactamase superfamily II)